MQEDQPSLMNHNYLIISKLCELGATDKDLAEALNVHISTINQWKLDFQQFSDTLKEGKKLANSLVEQSLFKRAIGAKVKEEKVFNNQGEIITHDTIKEFPPETGACNGLAKK